MTALLVPALQLLLFVVCRQKAQNKGKTSEEVDSGDLKGCMAHFQACGWDASDFDDRSAEGSVFRKELGMPSLSLRRPRAGWSCCMSHPAVCLD